jgi:hypothetical protein
MSGWVTTGGSIQNGEIIGLDAYKVLVDKGGYYESRTIEDDVDQVRPHTTTSHEFVGLSKEHAEALVGVFQSSSKIVTRTLNPIGGGGYNITQNVDIVTNIWTRLD